VDSAFFSEPFNGKSYFPSLVNFKLNFKEFLPKHLQFVITHSNTLKTLTLLSSLRQKASVEFIKSLDSIWLLEELEIENLMNDEEMFRYFHRID
jgi:hypothetical protein